MGEEERVNLVRYCILATSDIYGTDIIDVDADKFLSLSDEGLMEEVSRLNNLLSK